MDSLGFCEGPPSPPSPSPTCSVTQGRAYLAICESRGPLATCGGDADEQCGIWRSDVKDTGKVRRAYFLATYHN